MRSCSCEGQGMTLCRSGDDLVKVMGWGHALVKVRGCRCEGQGMTL